MLQLETLIGFFSVCQSQHTSYVYTINVYCMVGVTDYLTTEISTSKQKKFSLVTFVDTPGLVDGDMKCPFDVNQAILWLGKFLLNCPSSMFSLWFLIIHSHHTRTHTTHTPHTLLYNSALIK